MKSYTVVLAPDLDTDWITVSCPAMPGAASQGLGRAEALRNIVEAMQGWYEVTLEQGRQPLDETPQLIAEELAFVLAWKAEEGWPLLVETAQVSLPVAVAA